MLEREVFVRKALGAEDADASGAVAVQEIAALDHERGYLGAYYVSNGTRVR